MGIVNYALNPRIADAVTLQRRVMEAERYSVDFADVAAMTPLLWVDARSADAFAHGHVEGAVHLAPESFDDQIDGLFERWEPGMKVVIYCDSGNCNASAEVAERLRLAFGELATEDIFVLRGGWIALPAEWTEG